MMMLCSFLIANASVNANQENERGKKNRVKCTELVLGQQGDEITVTKGGKQYDGAFWSKDGQSMQFTSKNGKIYRYIVYYPNRKICMMKTGDDVIYYNRVGNHVAQLAPSDVDYCKKVMKEHAPEGLK